MNRMLKAVLPAARHSCWAECSVLWRCCCHCAPADSLPGSSFPVCPVSSGSTGLPQHQCRGISGAAKPRLALSGSTCCSRLPEMMIGLMIGVFMMHSTRNHGHGLLVRSPLYWVSRIQHPSETGAYCAVCMYVCMWKFELKWQEKWSRWKKNRVKRGVTNC